MPALVVASAFLAGALVVGGVPPGGRVRPEEAEALLEVPVDIVTSRSLRTGHEIAASAVPV